jgi:hypothetical protein
VTPEAAQAELRKLDDAEDLQTHEQDLDAWIRQI